MTVAYCVFAHNDLPMLRATIIHEIRWVNQICVLDLGSTDGTKEFCQAIMRPGDRYVRRETNTVPTFGFGEAHNAACALAETDWIYAGSASYCMGWGQDVRAMLDGSKADAISTETRHVGGQGVLYQEAMIERAASLSPVRAVEHHITHYRRLAGIEWRGYIHDEPYIGDRNAHQIAQAISLYRWHFEGWGDGATRSRRYCWMLRRAIREPELQKGTNPWHFYEYYPTNRKEIDRIADEYEAMAVDK